MSSVLWNTCLDKIQNSQIRVALKRFTATASSNCVKGYLGEDVRGGDGEGQEVDDVVSRILCLDTICEIRDWKLDH